MYIYIYIYIYVLNEPPARGYGAGRETGRKRGYETYIIIAIIIIVIVIIVLVIIQRSTTYLETDLNVGSRGKFRVPSIRQYLCAVKTLSALM